MTRRGTLWFGWALALLAIAGFARLGFWQYGRMHEKQAMLDRAAQVLHDKRALPLWDAVATNAGTLAWVEGEGNIGTDTLLLDNQLRNGRPGVRLYCLLRPAGATGAAVLADFGWLPVEGNRTLPKATCPHGPLHVRGLLAPPPSSGVLLGDAMRRTDDGRWLATRIDDDAIARAWHFATPPASRVVRLDPALPIGYVRDLDVLPNTLPPERHLGYAVQWWALALAVLATALVLTFRKPRP